MTEPEHEHDDDEAAEAPDMPGEPQDEELAEDEAHENETAADESAEASAPVGPTPEEWEDRFRTIRLRFNTYTRAVGKILEEDATDLLPCPLCADAIPGFVNAHDAGRVAEDTVGAVQAFIGYEAPQTLNVSRLNERCATCGGLGELETGSLVPKFATRVCDDCYGFGYRGPGNPHDAPGAIIVAPDETPNGPPTIDISAALASIQERQGT